MSPEIRELLEEILSWMSANDYECGEVGSELFDRIHKVINPTALGE